ncbi:TPA: hypothetical protein QCI12_001198 [Enterobacter roggenkampii]|nr:hypothetical protein [Enterobacter roggenkampii]HDR2531069.1 hypothetical protein [Enterobacter roggenkampii]
MSEPNNKELVAAGHQFARLMSSDMPLIDIAKMITRLAERLDCTTTALRETVKQRDASEQAERVWETTMMQACGEDGPKSVADKFASLQAKCDALTAENAAQREYRPQPSGAAMMEALDAFYEYHEDVPEQGMMAAFEILCCKRPQALATDAWQREQMAKGVEMFAASERSLGDYWNSKGINKAGASRNLQVAEWAEAYAQQLRNGEAV